MNAGTTIALAELYRQIRDKFRAAGLATPELDAKTILSHFLGCAPNDVILKPDMPVQPGAVLEAAVARRLAHEPVSKITGLRGFYGLEFEVDETVLDPRADTETLVDCARRFLSGAASGGGASPPARILDICTGTGCIPLALLSVFPAATAIGLDISRPALALAARNARRLGLSNRIAFIESDWAAKAEGVFDIITSNPPYIPTADIESLDAEVRLHDPHLALDGGADGLFAYRKIFPQIRTLLSPHGMAFFEIGVMQAQDVAKLAQDCGLQVSFVVRDLGGIERVLCITHGAQTKK